MTNILDFFTHCNKLKKKKITRANLLPKKNSRDPDFISLVKNKRNGKDQTLIERLCNPNPVANARKGYRAGIIPGWNRERERERGGTILLSKDPAKDPTP